MRARTPILAVVALAAVAAAQRPPSFAVNQTFGVPASAVKHRGKLLFFVDNQRLHVFSASSREWVSRPLANGGSVEHTNDLLWVVEPGQIVAFGALRTRFETLPVSGAATVVNPTSQNNDGILLVRDGDIMHAFSGFTGRWVSRAVTSGTQAAVQREVAVLADGNDLYGMSSLFGEWVHIDAGAPIASVDADGSIGVGESSAEVFGFSATQNRWARAARSPSAFRTQERDVAVWFDDQQCLAYSGIRGRFSTQPTGELPAITTSDHFLIATVSGGVQFLFSAPLGAWQTMITSGSETIWTDAATALIVDGNVVHAYSALRDSVTSITVTNPVPLVNATVAAVIPSAPGGDPQLFSAITGQWYPAPAEVTSGLPELTRNSALMLTQTGVTAFNARRGEFVPLTVNGGFATHAQSSSSILAVNDTSSLHVFEPRRSVWLSTPVNGGAFALRIWRTTLVATSGNEAIGYGVQHGALERVTLPGTVTEERTSSEVGGVLTSSAVVGYSAVADLTTPSQFPEFRRMYGPGSTLDLRLRGEPLALVGAVAGKSSATPRLLPWGELLLASAPLFNLPLPVVDPEGLSALPIPIPDLPGLNGVELALQALVVPPSGTPYLSRLATFGVR